MKLKFETDIEQIISQISALPETTEDGEICRKPRILINLLEEKLRTQLDAKVLSGKQNAKIRRQISYLWELYDLARRTYMKVQGIDPNSKPDLGKPHDQAGIYKYFVAIIKDIKSEKILQHPAAVKAALRYGVLFLSDHEIQNLIDNNKVK